MTPTPPPSSPGEKPEKRREGIRSQLQDAALDGAIEVVFNLALGGVKVVGRGIAGIVSRVIDV